MCVKYKVCRMINTSIIAVTQADQVIVDDKPHIRTSGGLVGINLVQLQYRIRKVGFSPDDPRKSDKVLFVDYVSFIVFENIHA